MFCVNRNVVACGDRKCNCSPPHAKSVTQSCAVRSASHSNQHARHDALITTKVIVFLSVYWIFSSWKKHLFQCQFSNWRVSNKQNSWNMVWRCAFQPFASHCRYEWSCHCINLVNLHNAIVFSNTNLGKYERHAISWRSWISFGIWKPASLIVSLKAKWAAIGKKGRVKVIALYYWVWTSVLTTWHCIRL